MSAEIGTGETYIEPYNIYFTNSAGETVMHHGELEIKFNVGTAYNGMTVKILHYHTPTGTVETLTGTVDNGIATVTVHDLCPFMAIVPESTVHVITASAGAGGSISPAGDVNVGHGGGMYFYFIPDNNYIVDKIYIDGVETSVSGSSYQFTNVTADHTIRATFRSAAPPPVTYYTVTASAGANGSISPSGNVRVAAGGSQSFTFIPNTYYEVDTVFVDGIAVAVTGNSYQFTNVAADHSVSVTFRQIQTPPPVTYYTITASAGAHGSISPMGSIQVAAGRNAYFYIIPDNGYEVNQVWVDGTAVDIAGSSYQFTAVTRGHTIHVTFREKVMASVPTPVPIVYHTITVSAEGHGSVSPSGSIQVVEGGAQTFYFIADEGYEVEAIYLNGEKLDIVAERYTIKNLTYDTVLSVTFRPVEAQPVITEPACHCLWARAFGSCFICGWFGRCIAPWCVAVPTLILAAAGVFLYLTLKRRHIRQ